MSRKGRPKGTRTKVPQVIAISKFRRVGVIVSEENLPVDVVEICRKFGNLDRIIAMVWKMVWLIETIIGCPLQDPAAEWQ